MRVTRYGSSRCERQLFGTAMHCCGCRQGWCSSIMAQCIGTSRVGQQWWLLVVQQEHRGVLGRACVQ